MELVVGILPQDRSHQIITTDTNTQLLPRARIVPFVFPLFLIISPGTNLGVTISRSYPRLYTRTQDLTNRLKTRVLNLHEVALVRIRKQLASRLY